MITVTFSGVKISVLAESASDAYARFCAALGQRSEDAGDMFDWFTETARYETEDGEHGDVSEFWDRGDDQDTK